MPKRRPVALVEKPDSELAAEIEGYADVEKADEVLSVLLQGGTISQAARSAGVTTNFVQNYQRAAGELGIDLTCPTDPAEWKRKVAQIQRAAVFKMALRLYNEAELIPRQHLTYAMGITQDKAALNEGGPTSIHANFSIKMNPDELAERLRKAQERRPAIEVQAETATEAEDQAQEQP